MKIRFFIISSFIFLIFSASAQANHLTGKCGAGHFLFKSMGMEKGPFTHVTAGSTNMSSMSSATLGVTSESSGCKDDGVFKANIKAEEYVRANFDNLNQEMARGGGIHLNNLAGILGCQAAVKTQIARMTQSRFEEFPEDPRQLLPTLQVMVLENPKLAGKCSRII